MRGRKAPGPEFAQRLSGDQEAKRRLQVILQTIAGQMGVEEAARVLGVSPQRVHMLREEALQAAVEKLTQRPGGRPRKDASPEQQRIAELEREQERLRHELAASQLREEIAVLLPDRPERSGKKRVPGKRRHNKSEAEERVRTDKQDAADSSSVRAKRGQVTRRATHVDSDRNSTNDEPSAAASP